MAIRDAPDGTTTLSPSVIGELACGLTTAERALREPADPEVERAVRERLRNIRDALTAIIDVTTATAGWARPIGRRSQARMLEHWWPRGTAGKTACSAYAQPLDPLTPEPKTQMGRCTTCWGKYERSL